MTFVRDDLPRSPTRQPRWGGLMEEATRRWDSVFDTHPDLAPAIELQRQLLAEVISLLDRLERHDRFGLSLTPSAAAEKLDRGVPALRGEPIEIPVPELAASLDLFCRLLAEGGAGDIAHHLVETLESGRISRASLLKASLARDQKAIQMGATQMGVSPDLVWLVGELATAPVAFLLQQHVFAPSGDAGDTSVVQSALAGWNRGFCPACGSWPALAEHVDDGRSLRCSYCAAAWGMASYRCVYCGEAGDGFKTAAPNPDEPRRLLELCGRCGGYTKAIQVDAPAPFPLVAIEDLETLSLDRTAIEHGYGRPPLPDLGAEATLEPPRSCEQ